MSLELAIYKKNRIKNLQNIFNSNVASLNAVLINNARNIQKTRLSAKAKQTQINNLINNYNNNVNILKQNLNKNITIIQNFSPKLISIKMKKKALLIGINYTGTQNELFGCINDANCIEERISKEGFSNISKMTDLTALKATKNNILNEFKNLLINSQAGDLLFFSYSGHGSYTYDRNNDETKLLKITNKRVDLVYDLFDENTVRAPLKPYIKILKHLIIYKHFLKFYVECRKNILDA
jgi:hypothetical protein